MELKKLIYTVNEDGIAVITMNYIHQFISHR